MTAPALDRARRTTGVLLALVALAPAALASGSLPSVAPVPGGGLLAQEAARPAGAGCPAASPDRSGAIAGVVRDDVARVPLPGAVVTATWGQAAFDARGSPAAGPGAREGERVRATAGPGGAYRLCGLPAGRPVRVRATVGEFESDEATVVLEAGEPAARDLEVPMSDSPVGRIVGRLLDRETNRPVTSAALTLLSADGEARPWKQGRSDGQGYFLLDDLYPGSYVLEIEHLGYEKVVEAVRVPSRRTVEVLAEMTANPVEVEPIVVTTVRVRHLENKGFYERKRWGERLGIGRFITREEIERRNPLRIGHMVAETPGIKRVCRGGGDRGCQFRSTRAPFCERAFVYVDGIAVVRPPRWRGDPPRGSLDGVVLPADVQAVEVYASAAELPGEFGGSYARCGAIVVWTRRGR